MAGHRVGGDVDAYCTKCRMILGHTIIAMVPDKIARVRCNTCQGLHAYKAGPPGTKAASTKAAGAGRTRPAAKRATREKVETKPFEELFAGRDPAQARTYSPRERFDEKEMIAHPTFGLGLVKTARQDKIDVIFKLGEKTLIHSLTGLPRVPVSFAKPVRRDWDDSAASAGPTSGSAADKPPPGQPTGLHVVPNVPLTEMPQRDVEAADADGTAASETVRE